MAVVAATIALDYHIRVLMTHTHSEQGVLEHVFSQTKAAAQASTSGGMDAIERLVQCGLLTPEGIRDHAESILKDRLELLSGSLHSEKHAARLLLPHIFRDYRRFYDLLFVDISSEDDPEVAALVMEQADLIVVNLSQNQVSLNNYFVANGKAPVPEHKNVLYCLGAYERSSRMNKERMIKQYGVKKSAVGFVPHHIGFMDAQNERRTVQFLLKAREARARFLEFSEEAYFTAAVRRLGQLILKTLEISPVPELEAAND
ncbi:hypothetical protein R70723_10095 [Paenibacillus sp. FSL R7-0273]|uniref:hypothetical protein n=1 Tax=Paenibacillus sp. FSL R7-0273 TaxID=1536772 RepID=UPI0004F8C8F8|nr:hypothetical protein [Paenibacillus sp. FSL R7-0273]AIQ46197.1 hypothetical protein R70723_10095 [Paenibacillus sp. FSL R7-0273]OMF84967.1 hypothetical protein BK144_28855 [Paenibacillus sp. FSL R7-0273]